MPLTASGQVEKLDPNGGRNSFVRIMAGIEALILAGVLYLVSSVRSQEVSMAELKASNAASQQAMAAVPAMTIRIVQTEKDVSELTRRVDDNSADIKELRNRNRLE